MIEGMKERERGGQLEWTLYLLEYLVGPMVFNVRKKKLLYIPQIPIPVSLAPRSYTVITVSMLTVSDSFLVFSPHKYSFCSTYASV